MMLFGKKKKEDLGEEDYFIDLVPPDRDVPRESLKEKPRPVQRLGSAARRKARREKEAAELSLPELPEEEPIEPAPVDRPQKRTEPKAQERTEPRPQERPEPKAQERAAAEAKPGRAAAARLRAAAEAKAKAEPAAAAKPQGKEAPAAAPAVRTAEGAPAQDGAGEDEDEAAIRAEEEAFEERKQERKRRKTERQQRIRLTMLLSVMFAVILLCILAVFFVSRQLRRVELPMMWSNETMAYSSAGQSAMQSREAFSSDLCIGANNVTLEGLELEGSEKGALFSLDDKTVVFSKDMFEKVYPASITKLMTAILALKSDKMDETVTITWQDLELESGSQVVGLRIGDVVSMRTLMRGLLIHSGNDAAQAIARVVGGTQEKFVEMMNEELRAIGATGSHFTNPTGLHNDNHYTTIYDIYLMLHEAMKYDEFISIIQVPVYDFQYQDAEGNEMHVTLDSTDRYLTAQVEPPKDVTVLGGKTGTTAAAGNCLSLISQNAYGQFYISIIVNALSKEVLYGDMNKLLTQINL